MKTKIIICILVVVGSYFVLYNRKGEEPVATSNRHKIESVKTPLRNNTKDVNFNQNKQGSLKKVIEGGEQKSLANVENDSQSSETELVKPAEKISQLAQKTIFDPKRAEQQKSDRERLLKSGRKLRHDDGKTLREFSHYEGNRPVYRTTNNVNAAISAGIKEPEIADLDLTGDGVLVGVWDGGSGLVTHQDYGGRVTIKDGSANHWHATHVIGTVTGSGLTASSARGMAPESTVWSYDWDSDVNELYDTASESSVGAGIRISNHSYSYQRGWASFGAGAIEPGSPAGWYWLSDIDNRKDPYYGKYSSVSRNYDIIAYNKKYILSCMSAGNSQRNSPSSGSTFYYFDDRGNIKSAVYDPNIHPYSYEQTGGYETIASLGMAKNIMTVGAVADAVTNGERDLSKASMSSFSSFGPSDDGRVKPDIVANGVSLYSTAVDSATAHTTLSGTSMASPSVAGTAALLQEYYFSQNNEYMWSSSLKGLLIHGADDLGRAGPDYVFGWGLLNLSTSIKNLQSYETSDSSLPPLQSSLANGASYSKNIVPTGGIPIKVTLCWSDVPGDASSGAIIDGSFAEGDRTPALVNDLDILLRGNSGTVYYPYKLDPASPLDVATTGSTNDVDNVEQVYLPSPSESFYTLEITHKGTLTSGPQEFSLIVSGVEIEIVSYDAVDLGEGGTTRHSQYADWAEIQSALPEKLTISDTEVAAVTWVDTDSYDPSVAGTYNFTGTVGAYEPGYVDDVDTVGTVTASITVEDVAKLFHYQFDEDVGTTQVSDLLNLAPDSDIFDASKVKLTGATAVNDNEKYTAEFTTDGHAIQITGLNKTLSYGVTLAGWIKPEEGVTIDDGTAIVFNRTVNAAYGITLGPVSNPIIGDVTTLKINWGAHSGDMSSNTSIKVGYWNFVALTIDPTTNTATLYSAVASEDTALKKDLFTNVAYGEPGVLNDIIFGMDSNSSDTTFIGHMRGIRMWNYDLPESLSRAGVEALQQIYDDEKLTLTPVIGPVVSLEGNVLSWSVEDEIGVKEYQIVDTITGKVLQTVILNGSLNYEVIVEEGVTVKLVVVDYSGFKQSFYPDSENMTVVEYDLLEGWNLIATPGRNAGLAEFNSVLWGWNGSAYEQVSRLDVGQTAWVYSPSVRSVLITAEKADPVLILNQGWNMTGPTENMIVPKEAILIYSWNKTYQQLTDQDDTLIRGIGYWIFCF